MIFKDNNAHGNESTVSSLYPKNNRNYSYSERAMLICNRLHFIITVCYTPIHRSTRCCINGKENTALTVFC
ncbi:hypothetical protein ACLOJK_017331 [Asimina triloba]